MAMPLLRTSGYKERLEAYSQILNKLYKAIGKISSCRIIIDSSKNPSHGFLLYTMSNIDLYVYVIHLVRDSRAVAYSWQRKKIRPEIYWKKEFMPTHGTVKSAMEWLILNTLTHSLRYLNTKYMIMRYEDLVTNLRTSLTQIAKHVGEKQADLDILNNSVVDVGIDHTVSGNPMRFESDVIKVRADTEWKENMANNKKSIVTALTWPLLIRYRYSVMARK